MYIKSYFLLALAAFANEVTAHDEYCRALVMSGGSNNGAWEIGVIWGLVHYGNPSDYVWDVVTGISAGAINTSTVCLFAPGDEVAMTEFLSNTCASLSTSDVWIPRPGGELGIAYAFFEDSSLLNDAPLF